MTYRVVSGTDRHNTIEGVIEAIDVEIKEMSIVFYERIGNSSKMISHIFPANSTRVEKLENED